MTSDAPDYTLLSDVNITGTEIMVAMDLQGATIAMPIDVQGATIALPVDIQGSTVKLNVHIETSEALVDINIKSAIADVKIYTPSGKWVSASETIASSSYVSSVLVSAGSESTLFSLTGRGRLMSIGFRVNGASTSYNAFSKPHIRVYIDGETSPSIDLTPSNIDRLSGGVVERAMTYGFNRVDYGTAGQAAYATALSPAGGLTWAYKDSTSGVVYFLGGFIKLDIEFTSSLEVKIYNSDTTSGVYVDAVIFYGEYP